MNQTSRTDEPYEGDDGLNQSPNHLSNDLTTNQDLNGIANARTQRSGIGGSSSAMDSSGQAIAINDPPMTASPPGWVAAEPRDLAGTVATARNGDDDGDHHDDRVAAAAAAPTTPGQAPGTVRASRTAQVKDYLQRMKSGGSGGDGSQPSPMAPMSAAASTTAKAGGSPMAKALRTLITFGKFVGPGFMVSVAYSKTHLPPSHALLSCPSVHLASSQR
jgi:metal iron transporter